MQAPFSLVCLWSEVRGPTEEHRVKRIRPIEVCYGKIEHGAGEVEMHRPTIAGASVIHSPWALPVCDSVS